MLKEYLCLECLVTPTEGKLISQETLQTTFQLHTPTSIKEPTKHPVTWPTLSQPFITPISTSVQPKRNFYNRTTDRAIWTSRNFNWSACQHRSNKLSSYLCIQAYCLPLLCSMSVWQTETKVISRQETLSSQGCSRQLEEGTSSFQGYALLWITTFGPPREDFSLQGH